MSDDQPVFTIQVNYKSGTSMVFRVTEFEIENGNYRWVAAPDSKAWPVKISPDHIESVWQLEN